MATLTLHDDRPPLSVDEAGRIRIAGSRVFLPLLVAAFQEHQSADELVRQFDSLDPSDVYATVAYYLRHRAEVDEYVRLHDAEEDAFEARMRAEAPHLFASPTELKARWAARNAAVRP